MVIYSIMPHEVIFSQTEEHPQKTQHITYRGQTLAVTQVAANQCRVDRIITTNLKAYLDPGLQPGTIIEYDIKTI
ncbi:YlzJ-like family protein [Petroclostridium sp. X23]|uniref:YlzJ-like family protein n=1 Tax=Petroclostridium sp. X23 TaxID=3045146 RepID=UPI0024ADF758|nr:YlzJ-like family protein [Petroclostridium sp. X23]WHH58991.1 YlzJ-like family protein [Petroclostridium sp. X23]